MSIPFKNATALNSDITAGWMPGAQTRGTASILYSCIITISLCVYTALHLNVPPPGEKQRWHILRQAKWIVVGVFAPEMVLYSAWIQYREAKGLILDLAEESRRTEAVRAAYLPSSQKDQPQTSQTCVVTENQADFDITYGFYAVMGGFRVDVTDISEDMLSIALFPSMIRILARHGTFLRIDSTTIKDKSKADVLAKSLVSLQGLWMLVQCIARKASGYPLTILEIHTFIHVICAGIMYAIWFKKPLNVNEATTINLQEGDKDLISCAILVLAKGCFRYENPVASGEYLYFSLRSLSLNLPAESPPSTLLLPEATASRVPETKFRRNGDFADEAIFSPPSSVILQPSSLSLRGLAPPQRYRVHLPLSEREQKMCIKAQSAARKFDDASIHRARMRNRIGIRSANLFGQSSGVTIKGWLKVSEELLRDVEADFKKNPRLLAGAILVHTAYGGVHMAAWNSYFPTSKEKWYWRASCMIIAGMVPLYTILLLMSHKRFSMIPIGPDGDWTARIKIRFLRVIVKAILAPLILGYIYVFNALIGGYVLARIFLVVESLISLRKVPIGVYATVSWLNFLPHF
ncbi:uncharacterized protein Z519_02807 [Cladophialophora bantiana CBS 173.52]|uniref:Uncharacterized protein n=1 Tax=Cladophialophora bantiana (strain ATCC 10958 / CBS 173.52 / CDC B-1940 / NIH 8579) TaxID=1442370 RepID=A0A0D2IKT7_CLAB1|nr:uncharacterized protein Z519_02807 [Cladophialophora bantiana CBS 173.52]KIW97414.1 hypothetical protein Z519_02807 [Cladophialophora bantiana CBS 173.52]